MGIIKTLDPITANSIAAGEVVERPASVVKELCENALDAGASIINVQTLQGGIKKIQVTDNGCGMEPGDACLAFERHATSKLSKIGDLESLNTMGFRGEALAAISAVSRVTLTTRRQGEANGTRVYIEGGELIEHLPFGCAEGSSFLIEDLFYNTPARFKFLRKDRTEGARVFEIMQELALAHPDVSFRLTQNQQLSLHSPGNNDLLSTIYAVMGKGVAEQIIMLSSSHAGDGSPITIKGAIGLPQLARRNRNNQYFFVNERIVKSPLIARALDEAYTSALMRGQYPWALIQLNVPANLLDVNVHPQKLELRFWNESAVFSAVYQVVKACLFGEMRLGTADSDAAMPLAASQPATTSNATAADSVSTRRDPGEKQATTTPHYEPQPLPDMPVNQALYRWNTVDYASKTAVESQSKYVGTHGVPAESAQAAEDTSHYQSHTGNTDGDESGVGSAKFTDRGEACPTDETSAKKTLDPLSTVQLTDPELIALSDARLIGILFDTYLVFQSSSAVYLIDQHAAHEKILYEELLADSGKAHHTQELLPPLLIKLTPRELDAFEEECTFIESLGFHCEIFSETEILLRGVPASAIGLDAENLFRTALDEITTGETNLGLDAAREEKRLSFATKACKAAVKAHDHLSSQEAETLRNRLLTLENPYQCPHGRPAIIKRSRYDIEKCFKRVI